MDIDLLALRVDCLVCDAVTGKRCHRGPVTSRSHTKRRHEGTIAALKQFKRGDHVRLVKRGWPPGSTARVVGRDSSTGLTVVLPSGVTAVVGVREIEPLTAIERLGELAP